MIRWFAAHPTASNLLLIIILAVGLFAAPSLKRETFPDYRPTEISIEVIYRGASAADVEDAICRRLYDATKSVEFLNEFICIAQDNVASATARMSSNGDVLRFITEIQTEVNAIDDFPIRAEKAVVRQLHRSDLVAAVAITADMAQQDLENYAVDFEGKIKELEGISHVDIRGMSQRQWQIEVAAQFLRQYDISTQKLAQLIAAQNIDLPLGTLETRDQDILMRFTEQRKSIDALKSIVVVSDIEGGEVLLGDISRISELGEKLEEKAMFNGQPALILEVNKSLSADALTVKESLDHLMGQEQLRVNQLIDLSITQDMTSIVRDRLEMLIANGVIGLLLVILVMSIFFKPRLAIWAVFGLPAAFMGAFAVMAFSGLTINMITLVALLMAIGIVMDDAIVITDNIAEHAKESRTALEAVIKGTQQVLPGVMSSFLTTASVFVPLAFLAGELGAVLEVMPVVLVAALAASLIEAFWILPHHLKNSINKSEATTPSNFRIGFDHKFNKFREAVGRLTDIAIHYRYHVLGLVVVTLLGTAGFVAGGHVGSEAMPDIDGDVLEARIQMPHGTPLERTEHAANQVAAAALALESEFSPANSDESKLIQSVQIRYNHNLSSKESGAHVATVIIDLLTAEQRTASLDEITFAWKDNIGALPGIEQLIIQEPGFGPAGIPVEVRLQGDDLDLLNQASRQLVGFLEKYDAVYNVMDDLRLGKPQRTYQVSEGAHGLGLTAENIASQMRSAFLGDIIDTQRIGEHDIEIRVRQASNDRNSLDDLSNFVITVPNGTQIPLEIVVNPIEKREWSRISRIDGKRTVTVEANVDANLASGQAIVNSLKKEWLPKFRETFPSVNVTFEGQVARSAETGSSIMRGLLIGLIGIFVILSFQFRSYAEPLIVMLSIPLAFVGVLWGHVLMGYYISMPSLIGAASLAGIVVNNAILLIHFIKNNTEQNLNIVQAAGKASRDRLRAILISSSTTIAGLLPLLAETSTQAASIKPMVISVVFGLLSATVLVVFVIPAIYVVFDDWHLTNTTRCNNDASSTT